MLSRTAISRNKNARDTYVIPDFLLCAQMWRPTKPPRKECIFQEETLGKEYTSIEYLLVIIELKRLPSEWYSLAAHVPKERKRILAEIDDTLDRQMRQQVYRQLWAAFNRYPKQRAILHIGGVGDFCRIRLCERVLLEENGLLEVNDKNKTVIPQWKQMTHDTPDTIRLIEPGTKDVHEQLKSQLARIREIAAEDVAAW